MERQVGFKKVGHEMLMDNQADGMPSGKYSSASAKGGGATRGSSACGTEWTQGKARRG